VPGSLLPFTQSVGGCGAADAKRTVLTHYERVELLCKRGELNILMQLQLAFYI